MVLFMNRTNIGGYTKLYECILNIKRFYNFESKIKLFCRGLVRENADLDS